MQKIITLHPKTSEEFRAEGFFCRQTDKLQLNHLYRMFTNFHFPDAIIIREMAPERGYGQKTKFRRKKWDIRQSCDHIFQSKQKVMLPFERTGFI